MKIKTVGHPVARSATAILNFVLGEYPVPDVFQSTDMSILGG